MDAPSEVRTTRKFHLPTEQNTLHRIVLLLVFGSGLMLFLDRQRQAKDREKILAELRGELQEQASANEVLIAELRARLGEQGLTLCRLRVENYFLKRDHNTGMSSVSGTSQSSPNRARRRVILGPP